MEKGFKQLLVKTGIFVSLFVVFSLVIGQKIVASELLYGFKIYVYGGLGKIFLFSILGFIILYRDRLMKLKEYKANYYLVGLSFILLGLFYAVELNIDIISASVLNIVLVQMLFLSVFLFLLLGVFGWSFVADFVKGFQRELSYFVIFGVIVYSLMDFVWKLWPYLSLIVLKITHFLLNLISENVFIIGERTLIFEGFSAMIAEACSGVFSMFIFTGLYLFIILLDWKKIDKLRAGIMFIPAVLGAFFMNILRVFLLFIFGAYVSESLALGLYHSYVGMLFFMIYFIIFWVLFYDRIKKPEFRKTESRSRKFAKKIMSDSLYRNSIYLMSSTLVMAILGFVFLQVEFLFGIMFF